MDNDKVHRQGFPEDQFCHEVFRSEDVFKGLFHVVRVDAL